MTATQLRRQLKKRVDALPDEKLLVAERLITSLEGARGGAALHKLAIIGRMKRRIAKAEAELVAGGGVNWRKVRSDV